MRFIHKNHPEWPKRVMDHRGLRVRAVKPIHNAYAISPIGTIFTVTIAGGGLDLVADPCQCCGIQAAIRKVSYDSVELIKESLEQSSQMDIEEVIGHE